MFYDDNGEEDVEFFDAKEDEGLYWSSLMLCTTYVC